MRASALGSRLWRILSAALFASLLVSPGPAAEIDARTMMNAEQSVPWRGVGRINVARVRQRGMCTGTLIAPDVVLTAAHCVVHPGTGETFAPGNIHFVAGWHRGHSSGHARAKTVVVHPDWDAAGRRPRANDLAVDLALLRLERALRPDEAVPFAVGRPTLPGDPLLLISYRRDRAHALTRQDGCSYLAIVGTVLTLDCAVTHGASGAPIFATVEGAPRVVAVLSAKGGGTVPRAYAARADKAVELLLGRLE